MVQRLLWRRSVRVARDDNGKYKQLQEYYLWWNPTSSLATSVPSLCYNVAYHSCGTMWSNLPNVKLADTCPWKLTNGRSKFHSPNFNALFNGPEFGRQNRVRAHGGLDEVDCTTNLRTCIPSTALIVVGKQQRFPRSKEQDYSVQTMYMLLHESAAGAIPTKLIAQ